MITYVQQIVAYLPPKHILIIDFDNIDIEGMLEIYGSYQNQASWISGQKLLKQRRLDT